MADDQLYPTIAANLDAAKDMLRTNIKGLTELKSFATKRLELLPAGSPVYGEVQLEVRMLTTQLDLSTTVLALIS